MSEREQNFQPIRLRPHVFLVHFSFGKCAPCQARSLQSGGRFGMDLTGKRHPEHVRSYAFLVLYLSSSHTLMSGGPDLRPDYYLTCNGSTGGVSDTDCMFSRRLLTRNAWKLMKNGCEMVVHGTKLMTCIFWGIIKHGFSVSLSLVQKHSSNVRRTFCQLHFRFSWYLSVTGTVMSIN